MDTVRPRLFLTGPIGCGKSTAISRALGDKLSRCGGFITRRRRDCGGPFFTIESPDKSVAKIFLDISSHEPALDLSAFSNTGVKLLGGNVLVLDEIGGIELLSPEFCAALEAVIKSDVPIIGVLKAADSANTLAEKLGLGELYLGRAEKLRETLLFDENTTVYECSRFDENALRLAQKWAEEYMHA